MEKGHYLVTLHKVLQIIMQHCNSCDQPHPLQLHLDLYILFDVRPESVVALIHVTFLTVMNIMGFEYQIKVNW